MEPSHFEIKPVAFFRSPFKEKFGIPRQSGIVEGIDGQIVLEHPFQNEESIRGIEAFDYLWLLWGFSANQHAAKGTTVRPPLLGGNQRMGVFATRSPYRPNPIGLSSVRLVGVERTSDRGIVLHVKGADLMDGTPIYDIKPYLPYTDAHPDARGGFTDEKEWTQLTVHLPAEMPPTISEETTQALIDTLRLDPRPHFHHDTDKQYGMKFGIYNVRFYVDGNELYVTEIS